jgi:hypothetical protein
MTELMTELMTEYRPGTYKAGPSFADIIARREPSSM